MKQIQTNGPTKQKRIDGNKFFNVPRTESDDRPPAGLPAGMPTQGEFRDSEALGVLLGRLNKGMGAK